METLFGRRIYNLSPGTKDPEKGRNFRPPVHSLFDRSLQGELYRKYQEMVGKIIKLSLGVAYIYNPKSNVLFIGPHSQSTLVEYDREKIPNPIDHPWDSEVTVRKLGKVVAGSSRANAKESDGGGDTGSRKLVMQMVLDYFEQTKVLGTGSINNNYPNMAITRFSQQSADANAGKQLDQVKGFKELWNVSAEFILKPLAKLGLFPTDTKSILNLRNEILKKFQTTTDQLVKDELINEIKALNGALLVTNWYKHLLKIGAGEVSERNSNRELLVLNIHTANDRSTNNAGNPELQIIIGSAHGLGLSDIDVEIGLALFLKKNGFNVFNTSLTQFPTDQTITVGSNNLDSKDPYPGELDSVKNYLERASELGIDHSTFTRDNGLEDVVRMRGTELIPNFFNELKANGVEANIIQLEIVLKVMKDEDLRSKLSNELSRFSIIFDNYSKLNKEKRPSFIEYLIQNNYIDSLPTGN